MVDAGAAVQAAQALNAATVTVTQSPATGLAAGQTLTLTAAASGLASGRSAVSTTWLITSDGGIVSAFASGASTATATIVPAASGSFTVRADVTDSDGYVHSQTSTVSVAAVQATTSSGSGGGGGGGGGAVSAAWLAALLLAAVSLKRPMPRLQRCRP